MKTSKTERRSAVPARNAACSMVSSYWSVKSAVDGTATGSPRSAVFMGTMLHRDIVRVTISRVRLCDGPLQWQHGPRECRTHGDRTDPSRAEEAVAVPEPDVPWVTLVHNDPVNLMSYVTYVFQAYFGYSKDKANKLMLDVHHKGRAIVSSGSREEMERDVQAMHGYGLWATLQQDR